MRATLVGIAIRTKKNRGTGQRRIRDRSEWLIERNTHEGLITDAQAETLLAQLQTSNIGQAVSRAKAAVGGYLLSGVLETSDGRKWVGAGEYYRLKAHDGQPGRKVSRADIDRAVLAQIAGDMRSDAFIDALVATARATGVTEDPAAALRAECARLVKEKDRAAKLALTVEDGGTFSRLVEERSRQIEALQLEIAAVAVDEPIARFIRDLTPTKMREIMLEVGSATAVLHGYVDRVTLDPDLSCEIRYRAWSSRCLSMASPRGFEPRLLP